MPRKKLLLIAQQPQIGQCIRALRQELNLSQEKFAGHLGVSFQAVNRWENGRATPSPLAIAKLEEQFRKLGDRGQQIVSTCIPASQEQR